eukprot:gb/GECG01008235.1/.p1 GENE.gb/GECG01008235.1/~~gb/GECG01008235.1/.p1  ORF type:complete len:197 (+),score=18.39 gb/GECG01008235.1/:1-591(+)
MASASFGGYNLVFVYGTLKRGFTNYERYMIPAMDKDKALMCASECRTQTRYPLRVMGERCVPVVYDKAGVGYQIRGELYFVDNDVLEALDMLEGVHLSFYYRATERILVDRWDISQRHITLPSSVTSYIYLQDCTKVDGPLDDPANMGTYDEVTHRSYETSSSEDSEILDSATRNSFRKDIENVLAEALGGDRTRN